MTKDYHCVFIIKCNYNFDLCISNCYD